jgi:hypothetical protein
VANLKKGDGVVDLIEGERAFMMMAKEKKDVFKVASA